MAVWKVWISEANCVRGLSALTRECVNNNYDSLYWGRQPNICPPPPPDNVPCTVYCVMHCTVQIVEMCQTGKLSNWFLRPRRIAVTGDLFSGNNECLYLPYPPDSICRTKILIGYSGTSKIGDSLILPKVCTWHHVPAQEVPEKIARIFFWELSCVSDLLCENCLHIFYPDVNFR